MRAGLRGGRAWDDKKDVVSELFVPVLFAETFSMLLNPTFYHKTAELNVTGCRKCQECRWIRKKIR